MIYGCGYYCAQYFLSVAHILFSVAHRLILRCQILLLSCSSILMSVSAAEWGLYGHTQPPCASMASANSSTYASCLRVINSSISPITFHRTPSTPGRSPRSLDGAVQPG